MEQEKVFWACVDALKRGEVLSRKDWQVLLSGQTKERREILAQEACRCRDNIYGKQVFIRGLIEISNFCKNDCYYCGIRRSNTKVQRYRLTQEEILQCCHTGFSLGFRTFVLQGGEDPYFTTNRLVSIVRNIKETFPQCALTLSMGEMERNDYQALKESGADRYLLRHETANQRHYACLHPPELSLSHRMDCLRTLKELGFQTGAGFMVGSPGQTMDCLLDDMLFLAELKPHMVGIGPFIPHKDTPFGSYSSGNVELTLYLLSLVRLLLPHVLLPATTALGTAAQGGREAGILAGANVVMPNLSPSQARKNYQLYDNKLSTGKEAAEGLDDLKSSLAAIGYAVCVDRGDYQ